MLIALAVSIGGCSWFPSWMGGSSKKEESKKLEGERIAVMPVSTALQPDDSVKNTPVKLPTAIENTDWAQHTGGLSATSGNLATKGDLTHITHATAGDGEEYQSRLVIRPVVGTTSAGSTVFAMDAVGNISAHDAANIETVRWKSKGVSEEDEPVILGGGLAYDDGKLYAVSGRGIVVAIDAATGKEIWHKAVRVPFRSAPRIASGKLFAITLDSQLYVLNTATGDIIWTQRGINEAAGLMNLVSPTVSNDVVVVPYSSGELYALATADGKEAWSDSLMPDKRTQAGGSIFSGIGGDPVIDGNVVITVSSGGLTSVFALQNGQRLWNKPIGSINTPWIAGDYLFMLTTDNTLVAMVKYDGRIRWATKLANYADEKEKKNPITWHGPVMVNSQLAVVGSNGQLALVNAVDGTIAATKPIAENIYTSPVVAGGRMYLVGQDAVLYELQ